MSHAVQVFEGDILMLSRKVVEDWLLLKPEPETIELVRYMFVYWGGRLHMPIYVLNALSNHLHAGFGDPHGIAPLFLCMVDHWIARIMNERLGRTGTNFFASGKARPMRLDGVTAIQQRFTYMVTNAVGHGLCPNSYDWPGLAWGPENAGETIVVHRPPELDGSEIFPETIEFVVPSPTVPAPSGGWRAARKEREAALSKERNGRFMGVKRAMARPKFSRPHKTKTGGTKPFFVASTKERRIALAQSRRQFLKDYDRALAEFRAGNRDVEWPPGTYKMRRQYNLPPPN